MKGNDTMYKITLADGTALENLELNGNNFISSTPVTEEMFVGNCSPITISDGKNQEIHDHAALVQILNRNGKYWFVLRDRTAQELLDEQIQSDIDYIAMMTEVDLEGQ